MKVRHLLTSLLLFLSISSMVFATTPASLDLTFQTDTGASGTIWTSLEQPDGKILIGGSFSSVHGVSISGIARLNLDGSLDNSFTPPSSNGTVHDIIRLPDGKLLLGGYSFDSGNHKGVIRLNVDGSIDASFDAGTNITDDIYTIELQSNGKILAGGDSIIRLNNDGSLDSSFDAGNGPNHNIWEIKYLETGQILIGGDFTGFNGTDRRRIARLNTDGSIDPSFGWDGSGSTGRISKIVRMENGNLLLGGGFYGINGIQREMLAQLDENGGLIEGFYPKISSSIYSLKILSDGRILIGGDFYTINEQSVGRIALLHADGDLDQGFDTSNTASSSIFTITELSDGKLFIGGSFTSYGSDSVNRIARIYGPNESSQPTFASFSQSYGHAGDTFTIYGSNLTSLTGIEFADSIAASYSITSDTSVEVTVPAGIEAGPITLKSNLSDDESPDWFYLIPGIPATYDPRFDVGIGASETVYALAEDALGRLIVAGSFSSFNGQSCDDIVRLNQDGRVDTTFKPPTDNSRLRCVKLLPDGKILVGGSQIGSRYGIIRLNADGTIDTSFDASATATTVNSDVYAIDLQDDGKILVGGRFTRGIARLNPNGTIDSSLEVGSGVSSSIFAIKALDDGQILAGGSFSSYNGSSVPDFIKISQDGSLNTSFMSAGSGVSGGVYCIEVQTDGKIVIGGSFSSVNGNSELKYVARFNADGSLDSNFDPNPSSNVDWLDVFEDGRIALAGNFTAVEGNARNYVAILHADGELDLDYNTVNGPSARVRTILTQSDSSLIIGGEFATLYGKTPARVAKLFGDDSQTAPAIASFQPASGAPGETLTLYGSNLLDVSIIEFSGGASANFTPLTELSGQVIIPENAMSGPIIAQNPYGSNQSNSIFQRNDAPTVSISSLPTAPVYEGDVITISGGNFYEVTGVLIGVLNAEFEILSATSMSITVPAGALSGTISLLSPSGNIASNNDLTVILMPPSFPDSMIASGVVGEPFSFNFSINGAIDNITIDPLPAGLVFDDALLTISGIPEVDGSFSIEISASNSGGSNSETLELTITPPPPPSISAIAPKYAIEGGEFLIAGDNLLQTQEVTVNGASTSFRILSNGRVAVTMPATGGAVSLTTLQGNTVSSEDVTLWSFLDNVQSITSFGDDSLLQTSIPAGLNGTIAVSAGLYHSLALGADGRVSAWGDGSSGQSDIPDSLAPSLSISAGGFHSLALEADGTIAAWGRDDEGQTSGPNGRSGVIDIAAGDYHSLALLDNGSVLAWGGNWSNQVNVPAGLGGVIAIDAHGDVSAALKANGEIVVWGNDQFDQTNIPPEADNLIAISVGQFHILGLKADGTVIAWGMNSYSQTQVPGGLVDVVEISAGDFHSMARLSDGSVVTWGADWHGQSTVPPIIDNAASISAGGGHSLVLRCSSPFPSVDGTVRQVTGKPNQVLSFTPSISVNTEIITASNLPLGTEINAVTGAISGTPIVGQDQLIRIAVRNQVGYSYSPLRLFIGPYITGWGSRLPSGMPAGLTDIVAVAAGTDHCLALLEDGTVISWGNDYGGKTTVPSDLSNVVAIAAGSTFSLALKENGDVIAWGRHPDWSYSSLPTPLANGVVAIVANGSSAYGLMRDGQAKRILSYNFDYTFGEDLFAIDTVGEHDPYYYGGYGSVGSVGLTRAGAIETYNTYPIQTTLPLDQISLGKPSTNYYYSPFDENQTIWGINRSSGLYELSNSRYSPSYSGTHKHSEVGTVIDVKGATGHALVLTDAFTIQSVQTAILPQDPWYYYDNQLDSTATLPGGLVDIGAFDVGPDYAIAIKEPFERPRITSLRVADGRAGQSFQYQATTTTLIDEFRVTGLPAGLTIDSVTGIISGVPGEVGIFNCLIIAKNADAFDTSVLSLKVTEGAPPYSISLSSETISEGLPIDTVVSALSALDPDTEDTHTYRLVTGDGAGDNSSFQISGTTLQTRKILDFETDATLSIRVEATDLGGNTFSRVFEIDLINVDTDDDDLDGLTEAEETLIGTDPLLRDSDLDGANDGTEVYGGSNPLKSSEKPLNYVAAWGRNTDGQCNVPIDLGPVIGIAVGEYHTLAIKADGTVAAWGRNTNGQCDVPAGLHSVVALAAGYNHSLALKDDGTVVAWGSSSYDLNTIPVGLSNVVEIAASRYNNFALKSDGSVVAWGSSSYDLNTAPESAVNAVAMAAGDYQMLTLNADGSSSGWGQESYGEVTGPQAHSNLVAIAAGDNITLALNSDNKLMTWAWTGYELNELPTGLGEIRSIAAGNYLGLVVETDGTLTVWGSTSDGKTTVPPGIGNVMMADAGYGHVVALVDADGFVPSTSLYTISATAGLPMYEDISLWDSADEINVTFLPQGISHDPITGEINGTPTETGNFLARVTAQKTFAQSTILLPIEIHDARRLSDWENVYFNGIEQANGHSGDLADIDLDNLPNLLEYALHRDPKSPDSSATTTSSLNSINQQDYLTLTYERLKGASDIRYIVEVSSDLINWDSGTDHTTRIQTINNAETEIISVRDLTPISTEIKRFMRLRVEFIY